MEEKEIGKVTHFFDKISVAIIELSDSLNQGDQIHIVGKEADFQQEIASMQVEHEPVEKAKKGDVIGLKVDKVVKKGDLVYKVG